MKQYFSNFQHMSQLGILLNCRFWSKSGTFEKVDWRLPGEFGVPKVGLEILNFNKLPDYIYAAGPEHTE